MPLPSGQKLGPYEIIAPLGAGGMGEVYKARDTRLDRPVAIKVSSERFSERFQREAQAIAALNHPHICTLYDVGPDYLVMELIDGKPLEGPMPVATALRLAAQIAAGLAEAHRHGIIHRDLKPANILVTRNGVKILDFGLAKLNRPAPAPTDETLTQALTQQGAILGTPRYMSPEQLEGREVDARSDIFSFGSVLYEMLSGKPAFSGKTQPSLAAAILTSEPEPITAVVPGVPPAVERLLKTCLAKDPEERRQSIRDVLLELRWCAQDSAVQPGPISTSAAPFWRRPIAAWALAAAAVIVASFLALRPSRPAPAAREFMRFQFQLPAGVQLGPDLPTVSPDGRSVVVSGIKSGRRDLYLRRFDEVETKLLPGTAGAGSYPFWSPDSRFVVFTSGGKLVRLEVERGSRLELGGEWRATAAGAWGPDGTIVMSDRGSLYRLPSSGGTPAPISGQGSGPGAQGYAPDFLPGGKLIYSVLDSDPARTGTYAASLGDNNPKLAIVGAMSARVAGDHLLFRQQRSILAQRISPASAAPEGEAAVVISEAGGFSVSRNGVLVHRGSGFEAKAQFAVYDADGRRGLIGPADRVLVQFEVSPDERRATVFGADETGRSVLSEMDLKSGILSAVTVEGAPGDYGAWSPDGREIALTARAGSGAVLVRKTLGDASPPKLVFSPSEAIFMEQWLTDNSLLYLNTAGRTFYRLRLEPGAKPEALLTTEYNKDEPQVAPGGRWIVYTTNESGQWEVYAATFPKFEQRRQISNGGGMQPKWRRDGRAIYYFSPTGELVVVSATPGPDAAIETGAPRVLFKTRVNPHPTRDQFAVLDGGRKFLVLEPDGPQTESIVVVVNWEALLDPKKR